MNWCISLYGFMCIILLVERIPAVGQEKTSPAPPVSKGLPVVRPPVNRDPPVSFSLESNEDIRDFLRTLAVARSSSSDYLEKYARGETKDKRQAASAVHLLKVIRADDEASIKALCANIGKSISNGEGWEGPHSLSGRGAATALVEIGGSNAKDVMISRLRHEVSEYELRTYAYVFAAMDKVPLTVRQLELAIERENKTPLFPSGPDKTYLKRLEFIKETLGNPAYFSDQKNWPSRRL